MRFVPRCSIAERAAHPRHIMPLLPAFYESGQPDIRFLVVSFGRHLSSLCTTLSQCRLPLHSPCPTDFPISAARLMHRKNPSVSLRFASHFYWHIHKSPRFKCCARTANSCAPARSGRLKALLRRIKQKTSPAACDTARPRKRGCFQCLASQP